MGEQQKFLSRIGNWFRRGNGSPVEQPPGEDAGTDLIPEVHQGGGGGNEPETDFEPRNTFLRPWAKRDQAIDNLNRGIGALGDLLVSIRENMEKQSQRQEDLLGQLTGLPEALRAIPEAGRVQGETLKAIHEQIERQSNQQSKLGDVLERISQADSRQGNTLEALRETVAAMGEHDQAISGNMTSLGIALESITSNSQSSAQVLESLRDNSARRDGELERVIKRQNTRFTTMLTVAIVLSISALAAVSVFGYLAYDALSKMNH
jgi:DNA repair exonuclease SbcCD ATPase subunit